MKPVKYTRYIAGTLRVAVMVLLFWFIVTFVQMLVQEMAFLFMREDIAAEAERRKRFEGFEWKQHRSSKEVLADGTIHLVYTAEHSRVGQGYNERQIFDVNGNLTWQGLDKDKPYEYLRWAERPSNSFSDSQLVYMQQIGPDLSRLLEIPVNSNLRTEEIWRYDVERQIFTGHGREGEVVGYIGEGGFAINQSETVGLGGFRLFLLCEGSVLNPVFIWQTDNRIYEINFETRQIQILFESPVSNIDMIRLNNWRQKPSERPSGNIVYRPMIFCRTEDNVYYLIMRNPEQIVAIEAFKNEDPNSYRLNVTATNEGAFLLCHKRSFVPPAGISQKQLEQYRKELMRKEVPLFVEFYKADNTGGINMVSRFDWVKPAIDESMEWMGVDFYEKYTKMISSVSPLAYDLLWRFFEDGMLRLSKRLRKKLRKNCLKRFTLN